MSQFSLINIVFLTAETVLFKQDFCDTRFSGIPSNWNIQGNDGTVKYQDCNGTDIIGGYNIVNGHTVVTARYENIPLHTEITVELTTYVVDSWDTESVFINIDGHQETKTESYPGDYSYYVCGAPEWMDIIVPQSFTYPHTSDTLNIKFTNNFNEPSCNESWGMRDFKIYIKPVQCIQFYSECYYQGTMNEICQNSPNQSRSNFPQIIKSIKLPGSGYLELQKAGFSTIQLHENIQCLDNFDFPPLGNL